jgi:hypothetical protein
VGRLSVPGGHTNSYPNGFACEFSRFGLQDRPEKWVGSCQPNQGSLGCDSKLSRGRTIDDEARFGIIRKAALYARHGPATVDLFPNLWGLEARAVSPVRVTDQQSSLFD